MHRGIKHEQNNIKHKPRPKRRYAQLWEKIETPKMLEEVKT